MQKIQPTTTITVDDKTFEVASMSDDVKQLIVYLDDWRQDEADQTSALLKTRAALHDLQNTLLSTLQSEAAAAQQAPVDEPTPPAPKAKTKVKKVSQ